MVSKSVGLTKTKAHPKKINEEKKILGDRPGGKAHIGVKEPDMADFLSQEDLISLDLLTSPINRAGSGSKRKLTQEFSEGRRKKAECNLGDKKGHGGEEQQCLLDLATLAAKFKLAFHPGSSHKREEENTGGELKKKRGKIEGRPSKKRANKKSDGKSNASSFKTEEAGHSKPPPPQC